MVSVHSDVLLLILHLPNATTSTFAVLPTVHKRIPWPACIHLLMSLSLCIPCETQSCTAQTTSRHHCRRRRPHSQAVYFTFLFSLVCCMSAYMDPRVETAAGVPRSTDRAKRRGAALAIVTGPPSERLFSQRPEEEDIDIDIDIRYRYRSRSKSRYVCNIYVHTYTHRHTQTHTHVQVHMQKHIHLGMQSHAVTSKGKHTLLI